MAVLLWRIASVRAAVLGWGSAVSVLLRLVVEAACAGKGGLVAAVLGCLPLADAADVDVLFFHRDEGDPAEFEPGARLGGDDLSVVATRTHVCLAVALLLDLGRTAKDDGDEKAKVLSPTTGLVC